MSDKEEIDASPTKEFFIEMLTRDISLDRAILDLIDNSVDAYMSNNISDPEIKIYLSKDKLTIEDNCGGIPINIAKEYAFRFGRPNQRGNTPNSVGQFGVGMKRTLFKIGSKFKVYSNSDDDAFLVDVDVDSWKSIDAWKFDFTLLKDDEIQNGCTKIIVENIFPLISEQFILTNFVNSLAKECSIAHFKAINRGLKIYINDSLVDNFEIKFKESDDLNSICYSFNKSDVSIKITAGISERKLSEGGWYIVCNGRLVSEAEQSIVSGWRSDGIPQYHPDYAYFRGVIEFEAENSSLLPWTTTKTGVDKDSPVYKAALYEMKKVMKEIIPFLRARSKEDKDYKDNLLDTKPMNDVIEKSNLKLVGDIVENREFTYPSIAIRKNKPTEATIQYKVPIEQLNKVKETLGVANNYEVGQETFDYYFGYECE